MLADMTFSHGAAFIDVEALLSAGDAPASGTGVAPADRLAKVTVAQNGPKLSVDWFRDDLVHLTHRPGNDFEVGGGGAKVKHHASEQ